MQKLVGVVVVVVVVDLSEESLLLFEGFLDDKIVIILKSFN